MEVYQNLLAGLQGKWICAEATNQSTEQTLELDFSLLISENLISRNGDSGQYWPIICSFELVGSIKDGYFYREDGCFMQVKVLSEEKLVIELLHKNTDEQLNTYLFNFDKDLE